MHAVLRRRWLVPAAVLLLAAASVAVVLVARDDGSSAPDSLSLRALAARHGVTLGTAVNPGGLAKDAGFRGVLATQFGSVTPEVSMKWGAVEPRRGRYDWTAADSLVDFARAHDQLVRGHTLVWHRSLPTWVSDGDFSDSELNSILHNHITKEVGHFRGRIWQWDVVNEAVSDDGSLRKDLWQQNLGPGYIANAFRWAHRADPKPVLFYNDYGMEAIGAKSNAVYSMVKQLRAEGVPIGGVGFETHLDARRPFPSTFQQNLQRFADLGVQVALTEVDVRAPLPISPAMQKTQDDRYRQALLACLSVAQCKTFTVWGFSDRYSWVPGAYHGEGSADLFDQNLKPKSQFRTVQSTLQTFSGR